MRLPLNALVKQVRFLFRERCAVEGRRVAQAAADGSGPPAGTRVVGFSGEAGWAQRRAVSTDNLAPLPEFVEFDEAARGTHPTIRALLKGRQHVAVRQSRVAVRVVESAATVERIDDAVGQLIKDSKTVVRVTNIQQKYGGLRIEVDRSLLPADVEARLQEAIDLAEARADSTCELCGAIGQLYDKANWLVTRCELHAEGELVATGVEAPGRQVSTSLSHWG